MSLVQRVDDVLSDEKLAALEKKVTSSKRDVDLKFDEANEKKNAILLTKQEIKRLKDELKIAEELDKDVFIRACCQILHRRRMKLARAIKKAIRILNISRS